MDRISIGYTMKAVDKTVKRMEWETTVTKFGNTGHIPCTVWLVGKRVKVTVEALD